MNGTSSRKDVKRGGGWCGGGDGRLGGHGWRARWREKGPLASLEGDVGKMREQRGGKGEGEEDEKPHTRAFVCRSGRERGCVCVCV